MRSRLRPAAVILPLLAVGILVAVAWRISAQEATDQATAKATAPAPTAEDSPADKKTTPDKPAETAKESDKPAETAQENEQPEWERKVDGFFGSYLVKPLATVLFYDFGTGKWLNPHVVAEVKCPNCEAKFETVKTWGDSPQKFEKCPACDKGEIETIQGTSIPLVVLWLLLGAIFFTIRMKFINFRGFYHAIQLTRGRYDNPDETGEVSHFQALASALSATIGLGNIAGVAIAVGNGGPGAIFWMVVAGLLGMSSKFAECSLSQMYRKIDPDGTVSGGPMRYLHDGLKEIKIGSLSLGGVGLVLAITFAVVCMGGSFAGGCAFQVSQSLGPIREKIPALQGYEWIYGLVMAAMVGVVIIGGIRRIAATAEKIVPLMCIVYVATAIYILFYNYTQIGAAFGQIFSEAFRWQSVYGGFLGVMVIGIKRAAFSNEAGIGSAAIAHAAAKTEEPIREGIVASLGPFIDTVVICTMTGLVIIITGVLDNPACAELIQDEKGATLTSMALGTAGWIFPWILCVAVVLFAYSTMISWSYYGERCWAYLFGRRSSIIFKLLFLVFVMLGSIVTAANVKDFADLMILSMAFPNILGVVLLSGRIKKKLDDYWRRYKSGEMQPYKK